MKKIIIVLFLFTGISFKSYSQKLNWVKQIGGTGSDRGCEIAMDASGNVYSTGFFEGAVDFDPGPGVNILNSNGRDIYVSKLDSSGNFLWAKQIGGGKYGRAFFDHNRFTRSYICNWFVHRYS
jgi:hypothetical protein